MTMRDRSILAAKWKAGISGSNDWSLETDAGKDTQYGEPAECDAVESTDRRGFDVVLFGLTPAAAAALLPARALRLARLPFRVGRVPGVGEAQPIEVNDLQLSDIEPFNVSRDHFAIERVPDGIQVRDRASSVGTIVNRVQIGRHHCVTTVPLVVGENEIVAGGRGSPFRFRVVVAQPEQTEGKVRS